MIRTVTGDVDSIHGKILIHEHLQVDLGKIKGPHVVIGKEEINEVIHDVNHVQQQFDCRCIVDVTAPEVGRNPRILNQISIETGLMIVCSTGYYWDAYSDEVALSSVETLHDKMIKELTIGIEDSPIRAGVIKIGTRPGEIEQINEKVFVAAAMAHIATGSPIITHTSDPRQALWQLDMLEECGVNLSRVLIGHLEYADKILLLQIAKRGSYLGFDQISLNWRKSTIERAEMVNFACENGLGSQILLSSDVAHKATLERYGGNSYSTVFIELIPLLNISVETMNLILNENPNQFLQWESNKGGQYEQSNHIKSFN